METEGPAPTGPVMKKPRLGAAQHNTDDRVLAVQRATAENLPLGPGEWQAGDLSGGSPKPDYVEKNAVGQLDAEDDASQVSP